VLKSDDPLEVCQRSAHVLAWACMYSMRGIDGSLQEYSGRF
jgi:hypothetical protein